ncbi:hypothetical protein, partial [Streptomyces rhizosphaericus]
MPKPFRVSFATSELVESAAHALITQERETCTPGVAVLAAYISQLESELDEERHEHRSTCDLRRAEIERVAALEMELRELRDDRRRE